MPLPATMDGLPRNKGANHVGQSVIRSRDKAVFGDVLPAEFRFLTTKADSYGWYVPTGETRDLIRALCARGLMAANGDFKVSPRSGNAFPGADRRRGTRENPSYYELIGEGCRAFDALRRATEHAAGAALEMAELPT